jgi:ATP-dependent DNA ligase
VFDVFMEAAGITYQTPHGQRFDFLIELFSKWKPENIKLVPYAKGKDKENFFKACQQHKAEGVIFKLDRGLYRPDERTYEALKYKFTTSADVFITALNKDGTDLGVELGVYDKGCLTSAGGVKAPKEVIEFLNIGDVIEVNYLYAEKSHKLYQPTWQRLRWDKKQDECTTDQFKYTNKEPVDA